MALPDPSLNLASKVRLRARATTAEEAHLVVVVATVLAPTTLATAKFTVLRAMANTAESSADTVLTASSHPVAPLLASTLDQDLAASAADSVELAEDSATESVDVQLLLVVESVALMLALVVVLPELVALLLVVLLFVAQLLALSDSVVVELHFVALAVDVVSELVSMVASALVPSEQALEASLELVLEPLL